VPPGTLVRFAAAGIAAILGCGGDAAVEGVPLRVVAYNIRHGEGVDRQLDLERIADVLRSLEPDVVALQEIDSVTGRTGGVRQASRLGELMEMEAAFGAFMDYDGGAYGMALLSRYPLLAVTNHLLPPGEEPRTALTARIRVGEGGPEVLVAGIHLYRTEEERLAQAARLVEVFDTVGAPVILAGDFNSTPGSAVMELLAGAWSVPLKGDSILTFPADAPEREIDFILLRPTDRFTITEYRVVSEPLASDHRPVLMSLTVR
jgi:endonuclease/exonuclease/phosphatase family metal-dependent hydrolase